MVIHYTSFSDITNPVYHNFNQPSVPDWSYPNQYNPCPQSYNHNFQNNFNSSQRQWGSPPPSPIFNQLILLIHLVHNIFSRLMVFYFELVELSMNLWNIVDKVDKEDKLVEN